MAKTDIQAVQPAGGRDATGFGATMTGRTGGLEREGGPEGLLLPPSLGDCCATSVARMLRSIASARESLTGVQWR
jgi:hypothetical protein